MECNIKSTIPKNKFVNSNFWVYKVEISNKEYFIKYNFHIINVILRHTLM